MSCGRFSCDSLPTNRTAGGVWSGLGGGVRVVEPSQVDTAAHRLDRVVEAVLRQQVARELGGDRDVVSALETAAQIPPGGRAAVSSTRLGART